MVMVDAKGPKRNGERTDQQSQHDGDAPAEPVRVMTDDQRTGDGSEVVQDGQVRDHGIGKAMHRLEKVGIEVLGAVRQASDGGHHQHQVDEILFVLPDNACHVAKAGQPVLLPGRRLGRQQGQHGDQGGKNEAAKKHPPPPEAGFDGAQSDRSQQISHGIAGLHDPGEKPTPTFGRALHHQRGADAPVPAHADAVKSPQRNENGVAGSEGGERGDDGEIKDAGDQRTAASIAIG